MQREITLDIQKKTSCLRVDPCASMTVTMGLVLGREEISRGPQDRRSNRNFILKELNSRRGDRE